MCGKALSAEIIRLEYRIGKPLQQYYEVEALAFGIVVFEKVLGLINVL